MWRRMWRDRGLEPLVMGYGAQGPLLALGAVINNIENICNSGLLSLLRLL
jgi:hypothetical protein